MMAIALKYVTNLAKSCQKSVKSSNFSVSIRGMASDRVLVKQGELQGCLKDIPSFGKYASFKGIPFAKPPIGDLRFKAPQPPESWKGLRDATEHGNVCPQFDMITGGIIEGNEDCLYLNVYKPLIAEKDLPVMIYFHGGAYMSGSGNSDVYGPEYLISQGVILVTVNYRLEALGFLCLDNDDVPGNAGLKDQVAAMKWVNENIAQFGGNPNNVTIYGESAGGSSATFHMFSPNCAGLFHRVISHSGVCISDWAYGLDSRERAFRVGKILGKETDDAAELAKFLRSVPATKLAKLTGKAMTPAEKRRGLPIRFCPVIEKPGEDSYLTEPVLDLISRRKFYQVPLLIGYNSHEGINVLRDAIKKTDQINGDFERYVTKEIVRLIPESESIRYGEKIKKFYFGDDAFSKSNLEQMVFLQSDYNFSYSIYRFAKLIAAHSSAPVYLFKLCFDSKLNMMKMFTGFEKMPGTCHADDLFYVFKNEMIDEDITSETETGRMILQIVRLWSNMAKFGNPTPQVDNVIPEKWEPLSNQKNVEYFKMGSKLEAKINPDKERMAFWDSIHDEVFKNNKSHL